MIPLLIIIDIIVKPDGGLSQIIQRKGFELVVMKLTLKEMLEKHYADMSSRPFFLVWSTK